MEIGFFRELPHGSPTGPSLADQVGQLPASLVETVATYLEAGALLAAVPAAGVDALDSAAEDVPSPHVLTDGRWIWPADLAYYVRRYHVGLPDAFLTDASDADWQVNVSVESLTAMADKLSSG